MKKWYSIESLGYLSTPALLVFPQRIKHNITQAIKIVGDINRLRPHVKIHKMAEVGRMLLDAGITKVKCATLAEAELMARVGMQDVLIAYQLTGTRLGQLVQLMGAYPQTVFSSLVDNINSVDALVEASEEKSTIEVYVDIDVGQHRTGVSPGSEFITLVKYILRRNEIKLKGFHLYDGHIRAPRFEDRKRLCEAGIERAIRYIEDLELNRAVEIVVGGSPSFGIHAHHRDRVCSPGTFVFWDHGYRTMCPDYKFEFAAVLATRVISKIDDRTYCFDLGHKHVASEGIPPQIHLLDATLYDQIGHSEEHLVLRFHEPVQYSIGQVVYGIPRHICPTVALYREVLVVSDHKVVDKWHVAARDLLLHDTIIS